MGRLRRGLPRQTGNVERKMMADGRRLNASIGRPCLGPGRTAMDSGGCAQGLPTQYRNNPVAMDAAMDFGRGVCRRRSAHGGGGREMMP